MNTDLTAAKTMLDRIESEGMGRNAGATTAAIRRRLDNANRILLKGGGTDADCTRYLRLHDRAVKMGIR